jgi:hypothetical protein
VGENSVTSRGRYRHYKGHLYEVLGEAKHSESTEVLGTAYLRLDADEPIVWVRPDAMFAETVEGKPRFEKVSDETLKGELHDCAENHYTAEEGRAMEKRIKDLEEQLHEPGYVDALREACEDVAKLVPKEWVKAREAEGREYDQLEALPNLVKDYIAALTEWSEDDKPLPEDDKIHAAHPLETDDHELYMEALRMVTAKRSKYALVDLVNWLLARLKVSEGGRVQR